MGERRQTARLHRGRQRSTTRTRTLDPEQTASVLDAPADDLVRFLRTTGELPDLRGLTVVLDGIGTVARPQQTLDPRREKNLIAMWTKIAEAGGAACVTSVETPPRPNSPVDGQLKPVKLVPVPAPPVFDPTRVTVLPDSGEVGFEPGQAVFRDPEAARTVLGPIAAQLKADHAYHLRLTGTTARWGPRDDQVDLARRRAAAVKQELISLGADPSQIDTRGTGSYFPQYRPDNGPGGVLLPGPAQANRRFASNPVTPPAHPIRMGRHRRVAGWQHDLHGHRAGEACHGPRRRDVVPGCPAAAG